MKGFLYRCRDYIDRNLVMTSLRNDYVRISLAWLDELEVHRLDSLGVALYDPFGSLSSFSDVSGYDPHYPVVIVSIHKELYVHLFAKLLACEDEYAFHDDHICRMYGDCLILGTGAGDVGIDRLLHASPVSKLLDMLAEQIEIYRVGMVEIVVALFLVGAVAEILVVCILRNYHDIFLQLLSDGPDYCSLSGTGSAGYSYYHLLNIQRF